MNYSGARSSVFINEFHYDNSGSDVDDGFEVAGPAGQLNFYKVYLNNGRDGKTYGSTTGYAMENIAADENGVEYSWNSQSTLQNGPDGIALVDIRTNACVQFISYE